MTHPLKTLAGRRLHATLRPAAAAALMWVACSSWAAPLDDIRRQVEGSQFEQAYQTALANPQLIGDVHFDFLYGVAAINVGRVPEGLLALERHLSAVPANDRARLELARGYFLLGEYARARSEFEFVLRYNPPAGVRTNITGFLQAMQVRENADRRGSARFYAEAGGGHDNNVNGGTFHDTYRVGNQVFTPELASRQVSDDYAQLAVGGQQLLRVSSRLSVFAGADLDHRANAKQQIYDLSNAGAYIGFTQLSGAALWRATLGASEMLVGGNRYRSALQLSADATLSPGPESSLVVFAQYAEWRHATSVDKDRDQRLTSLGLTYTYNFSGMAWAPAAGVRLSYGQEDNQRQRRDFSKQGPVLRLFAGVSPLERLRISAGLTASSQKYGGADTVYLLAGDANAVREDQTIGADVLANYAIDANWSVRAEAQWTITRSNQDLYDSSRKSLALKLRYQF